MAGTRRGGQGRGVNEHGSPHLRLRLFLTAPLYVLPLPDLLSPRSHRASASPKASRPNPLPVCVRAMRFIDGSVRREQPMAGTPRGARPGGKRIR
ncbi:unnamed protein product [Musa acuminata subsp. malaccensis]|uniref:(wild Malaysian banana) hypothetical protein n=1 Tax=Musa acuminata subsp. malaccensis TaxID=214687 RepID=A0A804J1I0_MUSAM|nr:unnamed protein product [Musa acuminata subsp. malaccensis]